MCDKSKCCQKPNEFKGKPEECSSEQIKKCHGDAIQHSCTTAGCEHPDQLSKKPEDCSPEQIRKCHGDEAEHPCVESQ